MENISSVKFKIFDMPDVLSFNSKFIQELVKLPPNSKIFATEFVDNILRYKWEMYGRNFFIFELFVYLLYIILFTFQAIYVIP